MLNNNNSSLHISMQTLHTCIPCHARVYLTMFICIWSCSCIAPHIHAYPAYHVCHTIFMYTIRTMFMYISPCSSPCSDSVSSPRSIRLLLSSSSFFFLSSSSVFFLSSSSSCLQIQQDQHAMKEFRKL